MKKLLILTAAIGFAFSVNAQQVQVREQAPASTQKQSMKMDVQLAKPATILNNAAMQKAVQKSTNAPSYTFFGQLTNGDYTAAENMVAPNFAWPTITLFPDSLVKQYQLYDDAPDSNFSFKCFPAAGFAFDPYSKSFDDFGEKGLFSKLDTMYGYKLDTFYVNAMYEMANYDASNPDKLRFYLSSHPVYTDTNRYRDGHMLLEFTVSKRKALGVGLEWTNPIPQKGNAVTPKEENTITWDYTLTPADSVFPPKGMVGSRYIKVGVPSIDGFEVEPGHVVSLVMKFIPGYDYDLGDTLAYGVWNMTSGKYVSDTIFKNIFKARLLNFGGSDQNANAKLEPIYDANGYNTFLMEDQYIRYKEKSHESYYMIDGFPLYTPGYGFAVGFVFNLYQSDEYITRDISGITERSELISAIYPNPATSQLTIDLKEEGIANVTVYNILGQALIQENVSDMSNTINISNLAQGMYTLRVTQNGKVSTVKFSKQ